MKDYWYDKVEVSIFLCGDDCDAPSCAAGAVTPAQRDQIQTDLGRCRGRRRSTTSRSRRPTSASSSSSRTRRSSTTSRRTRCPSRSGSSSRTRAVRRSSPAPSPDRPGVDRSQDQRALLDEVLPGPQCGAAGSRCLVAPRSCWSSRSCSSPTRSASRRSAGGARPASCGSSARRTSTSSCRSCSRARSPAFIGALLAQSGVFGCQGAARRPRAGAAISRSPGSSPGVTSAQFRGRFLDRRGVGGNREFLTLLKYLRV